MCIDSAVDVLCAPEHGGLLAPAHGALGGARPVAEGAVLADPLLLAPLLLWTVLSALHLQHRDD